MPAARTSARRLTVEISLAAVASIGTTAVGLIGAGHWLVTVLPAAYPCGETYGAHPSCRLAHPELVHQGWWLMTGVPAICLVAGLLVGALTFARWRHAITGPVLGFAVALVAFRAGEPMLAANLHDVVPW